MSLVPERGVAAYPRLWWRGLRRELGHTLRTLLLALLGLGVGWWLTGGWESAWAATWVLGLCSVGAVAAGELSAALVHRLREKPRAQSRPQLIPAVVRREIALVSPPGRAEQWHAGRLTVLWGVGFWFVLAAVAGYADELRPDWGEAMVASTVLSLVNIPRVLGAAFGPKVALFPERLEIRRGLGRYLIPWPAVAAVSAPDSRLTIFLAEPGVTSRRGWAPHHSAYGVRIRNPGLPISTLVDVIEEYRRDPAAHRFPVYPGQ